MSNMINWFNHQYPYSNLHELNLDWVISTIVKLKSIMEEFVTVNTIKYANPIQWNITSQYEQNTVVIDPQTGTAYISVKPVPSGIGLNNTNYWNVIFTLDIISANKNITLRDDANNTLATFESEIGDWVLTTGTLYKVIRKIDMGSQYVVGYNVERFTVELFIKEYFNNLKTYIGELSDLETTDKSSVINAINELVSSIETINDNIGDLSNLDTTDKSNIVNAINEVVESINDVVESINEVILKYGTYINIEFFGAVGDGVTDDTQAFKDAFVFASNNPNTVIYLRKKYKITDNLTIPKYTKLLGVNTCYDSEDGHAVSTNNYIDNINSLIWINPNNTLYLSYGATIEGIAIFNNSITYDRYNAPADSVMSGTAISTKPISSDNRSSGSCSIINCCIAGFNKGINWVGSRGLIENCLIDCTNGVEVTKCYDILRIKSVHVWPFCGGFEQPIETPSMRNGTGIYLHDGADDTMISDCFVVTHTRAYHVLNTNTIHFESCSADTCTSGILFVNANNCMVSNTLFINVTSGLEYVSGAVTATCNTFIQCTNGIIIDNTNSVQAVRNCLTIVGNTFNKCTQAMLPYNVTYSSILVSGNTFHSCDTVYVGTTSPDFVITNDNMYKACTTIINGSRAMPAVTVSNPLPAPSPIQPGFILNGTGTVTALSQKGFDGQIFYIHITGTITFENGTNLLVYGGSRTFNNGQTVILLCVGGYWRIVN